MAGTGELVGRDQRVLQRLPGDFERQAMLRVHEDRLTRGDPEEGRVETGHVGQIARPFRRARTVGERDDAVASRRQGLPEQRRVVAPGGHAAADTDHGNRGIRRRRGAGSRHGAGFTRQMGGERHYTAVLEQQCRA